MIDLAYTEAARASAVARYAAALACLGLAFDLVTSYDVVGVEPVEVAAIVVTGALFALLWWRRDRPTLTRGIVAFLAVNAAVLAALWVNQQRIAESGVMWVPFRPYQLGALAVALLAPSRVWVGAVTIVGFTATALVQFAMFDASIRARLPYGDPWATLAFGGFALGLLLIRLRATRIEREMVAVQVRMNDLERFAHTMLAVRDLANTPLQTLKISVDLLRLDNVSTRAIADRIDRAVQRLEEIEQLASAYDVDQPWSHAAEALASHDVLRDSAADPALNRAARPTPR